MNNEEAIARVVVGWVLGMLSAWVFLELWDRWRYR